MKVIHRTFLVCLVIHCAHALNFKLFAQSFCYKTWYNHKHAVKSTNISIHTQKIKNAAFEEYLLKNDDTHCASNLVKRSLDIPNSRETFAARVIYLITQASNPNNINYVELERPYHERHSPFNTIVVRNVETPVEGTPFILPAYLRATIRPSHLRTEPREFIPRFIYIYLNVFVKSLRDDQAGQLLSESLGGPSLDQFNFSPQTPRLNTNTSGMSSRWLREENEMRDFLLNDDGTGRRYIDWQLIVLYGDSSFRPVGFCLAHQNYNEAEQLVDNNGVQISEPLPLICFSNNPNDPCVFQENN